MNRYGIKILYRIEVGEDTFYEESVLQVCAESFEEAFIKAERYAQEQCKNFEYVNPYGETVRQCVVDEMDGYKMLDPNDDVLETYSRILIKKPEQSEQAVIDNLFERANTMQMFSMRFQDFIADEIWTRAEVQTLEVIYRHEPISQRELEAQLKRRAGDDLLDLLEKKLIEKIVCAENMALYRTAARFHEIFT